MVPDHAQYVLDGTEIENEYGGVAQVLLDFQEYDIYS